jgi:hypothetical protein
MAKLGKVNVSKVKKDKEERSKAYGGFTNWLKFKNGPNFIRMLPPVEGEDLPWIRTRKHFNLGPNQKGVSMCTPTGNDCYICKKAKILSNSPDKKQRDLGMKYNVSRSYAFQCVDMTPMYSKEGKKWVADNPPPKCWGQAKVDDDGDFVGKCGRCSWNESCSRGVQMSNLSGQRIDDIADYFDECDLTDFVDGRNILVKRKGEGFGTSYTIDAGEAKAFTTKRRRNSLATKAGIHHGRSCNSTGAGAITTINNIRIY